MDAPAQTITDASDKALEAQLRAELVSLVYRLTPFTLAMAVVFSTMIWLVVAPTDPPWVAHVWYVANNVVSLLRYLLIVAFRRAKPSADAMEPWKWHFVVSTFLAGTVWGLMGTALYPPDNGALQAILITALIGVSATGLFTLTGVFPAYAALAVPILLPPAVFLMASVAPDQQFLGIALMLFLFIALSNSWRFQKNTAELLRLRLRLANALEENRRAREIAESASQAKSTFLATVSHEIRTPMNGVLGVAQLLLEAPIEPRHRRYVEMIYRSGEHLLDIINDILDFSKIEAGRLDLVAADFNLRQTVTELTDLFAQRARAKQLDFTLQIDARLPETLRGDEGRLKQVLTNLIGNAIKFTDQGWVRIALRPAAQAPRRAPLWIEPSTPVWVQFAIADSGIGIAPEQQSNVFEAFTQAEQSHSRRFGGTGLGLSISRQLVGLMGGEIALKSEPGRGTVFEIVLPFAPALRPAHSPADLAVSGIPGPLAGRVLVVEDNLVNLEVAVAMLQSFGLDTGVAANGQEAVRKAEASRFDAILMDCQLPGFDGFEAARRIRQREADSGGERVPIIALTAYAVEGDRERCIAAGMNDYLTKPFKRETLYRALSQWLPAADVVGAPPAVEPAQASAPAAEPAPAAAEGRPRAIIADDQESDRLLIKRIVEGVGYQVIECANGAEAIEHCKYDRPDLVVLDGSMPGMNGIETCAAIKADPAFAALPVILLTGMTDPDWKLRAFKAGVAAFVEKAIGYQELKASLREAVLGVRARAGAPAGETPGS